MQTQDYKLFDFFNSNRAINESAVKKIMQSIEKIGYIKAKPIIVNKDLLIIDGQHRYEACKRLNLPIFYEEVDIDPNMAMVELNSNQQMWKLIDYVHSYASQGIDCYKQLIIFSEKYKLGDTNSLNILFNAFGKATQVRKGIIFKINPNAEKIVEFLYVAKEFLHFYKATHFVSAVILMFEKIPYENIKKILKDIAIIKQQATVGAYLLMFENIHNKNIKHQSKRISLSI